jgi:hypothetical protein
MRNPTIADIRIEPEFFNLEFTTEGLVAGCGSLVLK